MKKQAKRVRGATPIIYMSGRHGSSYDIEGDWIKRTHCKYRCYSFAYCAPEAFYFRELMGEALRKSIEMKQKIMLDSGAFSFHKFAKTVGAARKMKQKRHFSDVERLREETIQLYIKYLHETEGTWDWYANFDYIKDCATIYKMQKRLEAENLQPVPIYHGDDSLDWLKKYIDEGHTLIGIGNADNVRRKWRDKRFYFDQVFKVTEGYGKGINLHGFAFTSISLMFQYPWYSLDSATWVKVSAYGHILSIDPVRHVIGQVHVSDRESINNLKSYNRMEAAGKKVIRDQVESSGFDFDKVRTDLVERCVYNGYMFNKLGELGIKPESKTNWEDTLDLL